MNPSAASETIDANRAAELALCTPRWIRELVKQGYIAAPASRGAYDLTSVVHGRIRALQDDIKRSTQTASLTALQEARRKEVELRIAERDNRLIDLEEHDLAFNEIFGVLKSELMGLPARVTKDRAMRRAIERALDDCFARAAERFAATSKSLRETGTAGL